MDAIYKELALSETIINLCLKYAKYIKISNLFLNEFILSCPNIDLLSLLTRLPFKPYSGFFGAAHGWGGQKGPHPIKSVTHIMQ